MSDNLLKSRRFLPLLITQFFGALNDNLFKNALLTLVAFSLAKEQSDILSNVIAGLFILPFFLFSATAGQIADKYSRDKIAVILKLAELGLMAFIAIVFALENLVLLVVLLTLMGAQSAFFGPIKYALLPQHLKQNELITGNAYIEATTYFAIMLGLILGTLLPLPIAVGTLITFSLVGLIASRFIPEAPAPRPTSVVPVNIFKATIDTIGLIRKHAVVFRCILGATWFWIVGSLVVVQIYPLASKILNTTPGVVTFFLILFSIGVGAGSFAINRLLKGMLHMTYVPVSAVGMSLCFCLLYMLTTDYPTPLEAVSFTDFFKGHNAVLISLTLFMTAFFGGLYIVPLNALMQTKAPKAFVASVIAGNNILNALGMAVAALFAVICLAFGMSISKIFLITAVVGLLVAVYICSLLPNALFRSIVQAILKPLYKVKMEGLGNYRKVGRRAIIIANHASLLDPLLIWAFMPDNITFGVNTEWTKKWFFRFFGLFADIHPIDPTSPMALRSLVQAVRKNKKVMLFPEGRVTVTGSLMKVYEGAGIVAERSGAKILPVRIDGAQYSKFSYLKNKFRTRFFPEIKMTILPPQTFKIPAGLSGRQRRKIVSNKLYDVMAEMIYRTSNINRNLFNSLLVASHIHGLDHKIAEDISRKPLSYKGLIQKSYVLGEAYQQAFKEEEYVGLLLPNVLANVVSFFALQSIDKVPVMLNFSQGTAQMLSCINVVKLKVAVTSHKFVEQAKLTSLVETLAGRGLRIIYLEDFAKEIGLTTKLIGLRNYLIRRKPKRMANETAVVLFTSGSEGTPKAVLLSHRNIQANRFQIRSVIALNSSDIVFNALPMFHSMGLTAGTLLTTLSGIKTFYYPSPLHYRIVPELTYDTNATIIFGTDTFFYGYARMGNPYDFYNLKYALVGGEKLKTTTANLWMKKFGVRILEGYGTTEASPVLSINTPMHYREGTVGRLLPGIKSEVRPIAGVEEGGELWVKGDNIMLGYMKADAPGKLQPVPGGWYGTGDIVKMDEDDFITIQGRAKRFAKIGGEMISLAAVEQVLGQLYDSQAQGVVTVSDEKKGEQMIFITDVEGASLDEVKRFFKSKGFTELWLPKRLVYMKKPPLLGTGKFDYRTAKKMVSGEKQEG